MLKIDEIRELLEKGIQLGEWSNGGQDVYLKIRHNTSELVGHSFENKHSAGPKGEGLWGITLGLNQMKNFLTDWIYDFEEGSQERLDKYQWFIWFLCIQIQDWIIDEIREVTEKWLAHIKRQGND